MTRMKKYVVTPVHSPRGGGLEGGEVGTIRPRSEEETAGEETERLTVSGGGGGLVVSVSINFKEFCFFTTV